MYIHVYILKYSVVVLCIILLTQVTPNATSTTSSNSHYIQYLVDAKLSHGCVIYTNTLCNFFERTVLTFANVLTSYFIVYVHVNINQLHGVVWDNTLQIKRKGLGKGCY